MTLVAFSRVRRLEEDLLSHPFSLERLKKTNNSMSLPLIQVDLLNCPPNFSKQEIVINTSGKTIIRFINC